MVLCINRTIFAIQISELLVSLQCFPVDVLNILQKCITDLRKSSVLKGFSQSGTLSFFRVMNTLFQQNPQISTIFKTHQLEITTASYSGPDFEFEISEEKNDDVPRT